MWEQILKNKNNDKLKATLELIIKLCDDKDLTELKLWKLLFFVDLKYFTKYGSTITGVDYIRNAHGPTPYWPEVKSAVESLEGDNMIKVIQTPDRRVYKSCTFNNPGELTKQELQTIIHVCETYGQHTATELRGLSHMQTVYFSNPKNGGKLNFDYYYYQDDDYEPRILEQDELKKAKIDISESAKTRLFSLLTQK